MFIHIYLMPHECKTVNTSDIIVTFNSIHIHRIIENLLPSLVAQHMYLYIVLILSPNGPMKTNQI